jgi:hypothetical protein
MTFIWLKIKFNCFEFHSNCFIIAQQVSFIMFLLFLRKHVQNRIHTNPDKFQQFDT